MANLYYEHKKRPTDKALLGRLLDAIDARNAEIQLICDRKRRTQLDGDGGWAARLYPPPGHGVPHLQLQDNRYRSRFKDTAVNWDTAAMRKEAGLPAPVIKSGGTTVPIGDFEDRH